MFIHLGNNYIINTKNIIGIFDFDNCTVSLKARQFLERAEKEGQIVNTTSDIPKTFVVVKENGEQKVYFSQLSSKTLLKRQDLINNI